MKEDDIFNLDIAAEEDEFEESQKFSFLRTFMEKVYKKKEKPKSIFDSLKISKKFLENNSKSITNLIQTIK